MRRNNYAKKRKLGKLFVTFAAVGAIAYGASLYFGSRQSANDVVVAKINNQKIYQSEIDGKIKEIFAGGEDEIALPAIETFPIEVVETFAKEVYLEKQLVAKAKKAGVTKDQNVKQQLRNAKNRIISNAYLTAMIKEKVSAEKVSEKYSELNSGLVGKKEFSVAHIVVKTKSEAEKIHDALTSKKAKKNFSDLAKKYSIDKDSAKNGGKLGYILEDNMLKEVLEVASKLKKGDVSKPVETKSGWHIIKIEDVRDAKQVAFEDVKDGIREQMIKDVTGEIYKDIFDNVKIEVLIKKSEKVSEEKIEENAKEEQPTQEVEVEVEAVKAK